MQDAVSVLDTCRHFSACVFPLHLTGPSPELVGGEGGVPAAAVVVVVVMVVLLTPDRLPVNETTRPSGRSGPVNLGRCVEPADVYGVCVWK